MHNIPIKVAPTSFETKAKATAVKNIKKVSVLQYFFKFTQSSIFLISCFRFKSKNLNYRLTTCFNSTNSIGFSTMSSNSSTISQNTYLQSLLFGTPLTPVYVGCQMFPFSLGTSFMNVPVSLQRCFRSPLLHSLEDIVLENGFSPQPKVVFRGKIPNLSACKGLI